MDWWDDPVFDPKSKAKATTPPPAKTRPSILDRATDFVVNEDKNILDAAGRGAKDIVGYVGDAIAEPFVDLPQEGRNIVSDIKGQPHPITAPSEIVSDAAGKLYDKEFGPPPTNQSTADKYIHAGVEGAVSMAPFGVAEGAPAFISGAGQGIGGQAASDVFPRSPLAPILGSLAGGLSPAMTHALGITSMAESHNNPNAVSPKGARGLMQVMPETARDPGHGIRPSNGTPQDDVRVGTELFQKLNQKYGGDYAKTWAAYNWGEGRVDRAVALHGDGWLDHAPKETRDYVAKNMAALGGKVPMGGDESMTGQGMVIPPEIPADIPEGPSISEGLHNLAENETQMELPFEEHPDNQVVSEVPQTEAPISAKPEVPEDVPAGRPMSDESEAAPEAETPEPVVPEHSPLENMADYEAITEEPTVNSTGPTAEGQPPEPGPEPQPPAPTDTPTIEEPVLTPSEQQEMDASTPKPDVQSSVDTTASPDNVGNQANDNTPEPTPEEMSGDIPPPNNPPPPGDELPPVPPSPSGGGPEGPEDEGLPKYAGSINLNRLSISNGAKRQLLGMVKPEDADPKTFANIIANAKGLLDKHGFSNLLRRTKIDPKDFEAYQHAIRVIHASLQEKAFELGKLLDDPTKATDAVKAAFLDTIQHLGIAYERDTTNARMAARGLSARRINVGPTKEINDLVENLKQGMTPEEIWDKMKLAPDKAGKVARDAIAPSALDYFRAYYYNVDLLSRPTTIEHVFGGNLMISAAREGEHVFGAIAGIPARLLGSTDAVTFHELWSRMVGHVVGIKKAFTRGIDPLTGEKTDAPFVQAWKEHRPLDWGDRTGQNYNVLKGKGWLPFTAIARSVSAVDELARNFSRYSEIYGAASRQAFKEGLSGKEFNERFNQLANNPTPKMLKGVGELAKQVRLQDTPSPIGRMLQEWSHSKHPTVSIPATFLFPFVRMMDASTRLALRYTPGLGFLDRYNRADFKAGYAGKSLVAGRMAMGTAAALYIAAQTQKGNITGLGPVNPSARKQWLVRHQEESIKVGDHWVSYSWTPFAPLISGIATGATRLQEAQTGKNKGDYTRSVMAGTMGFAHGIIKSGWAGALSDIFDTFEDSNQGLGKAAAFAGKTAASVIVPGAAQRADQVIDPVHRDLSGTDTGSEFLNQIKGVTPGLSKDFPVQHDVYGNKIVREGGVSQWINPSPTKTIPNDFVSKEIDRVGEGVVTGAPRSIQQGGEHISLTPQQHQDYQRVSGQLFHQNMADRIQSPDWSDMTKAEQREAAKKVLKESRAAARETLFSDLGQGGGWNF